MTTTDVLKLVCNAVCDMLPELDTFEVSSKPPEDYPFDGDFDLWLHLTVGEERFDLQLGEKGVSETPEELIERIRSELQDWIAESRFAWGQLRV